MGDEKTEKLALHIRRLFWHGEDEHDVQDHERVMAESIVKDPKAHIDALFDAGVLVCGSQRHPVTGQLQAVYTVVQHEPPHKHEPYIGYVSPPTTLLVKCRNCPETDLVLNKFPLELPEDWR
jgi:hypothetical protein